MATTSEIALVRSTIESQGVTIIEATEAGTERLKIDYCEGTPAELSERVSELVAQVRGMFVIRGWNDAAPQGKSGRPTAKTAPFTWRVMGMAGSAPIPANSAPSPYIVERSTTSPEIQAQAEALAALRLELEVMRQSHRYERELADLQRELDDERNAEPEPDEVDRYERIGDIVERVLDRVMPYIPKPKGNAKAAAASPIQGPPMDIDKSTALMVAIERFKRAEPAQFEAIEKQLMDNYGQPLDEPEPAPANADD